MDRDGNPPPDEWRSEDDTGRPEAPGHTLPASEDQVERFGGGSGGDVASGFPGAVSPPD